MSDEKKEETKLILQELLEFTRKLSRCEEDPDLDVTNLALHCQEKLKGLQKNTSAVRSAGDSEIKDLLSALEGVTEQSIEALSRRKDQIEGELTALRRSQKAASAYGKRK